MDLYAVIMAGGVGSRFWPRSKQDRPKQLINIFGENSMIRETVNRLDGLIDNDKIYVITNTIQKPKVKDELPDIPAENIIDEPFGKNTAACIGLASVLIENKSKDAVTITLPADHLITDVEEFVNTLKTAAKFAYESKGLVTIGINPTRPETGYGYIQIDESESGEEEVYKVINFAEKPNYSTAKRFIEAGDFMWNSGIFIWRIDSIMNEFKKYMPELTEGLAKLKKDIGKVGFPKTLANVYGQLKSISIDYGVMEKSHIVYLVKGMFNWSDVGSWEAVYQLSEKDEDQNVKVGDVYAENSYNSYVYSPDKFTAVIGSENLIVINTDDALLICERDRAQDVKHLVDYLRMNKRNDLI